MSLEFMGEKWWWVLFDKDSPASSGLLFRPMPPLKQIFLHIPSLSLHVLILTPSMGAGGCVSSKPAGSVGSHH